MKAFALILLSVSLAGASLAIRAEEGVLLIHKDGRYALLNVGAAGFKEIATLGVGNTIYGESGNSIGVASQRDAEMADFTLIDKTTLRTRRSWPVDGQPAGWLSGPMRDVVVTDQAAYFLTLRFDATGQVPLRNAAGGIFDLRKRAFDDAPLVSMPLPEACLNPRLVAVRGSIFIYSWNGTGVWKLDDAAGKFEQVVSAADFAESARSVARQSGAERVFADFVLLPDLGVFRLSKQSILQHVLGSDFRQPAARRDVELNAAGDGRIVRMYGGRRSGRPMVGVLRQGAGRTDFSYVNPLDGAVEWTTSMPNDVVPDSLLLAPDGAVFYVDRSARSVVRSAPQETREVWNLRSLGADVYSIRIVSVTGAL